MALYAIFLILGLIVGSFLNVCIHRIPKEESIVFPFSYCPACKKRIGPLQNIPIISFLLLRGRCRNCHEPISWRYPLVEFLNGAGYLFILHRFGPSFETLIYALFFSALLTLTFIDLAHQILPDVITLPGIVLGVLASSFLLPTGWKDSLIGLFIGGGLFYLIAFLSLALLKKEGMGGGDIKLVAMIGAFLGWKGMLLAILSASVSGSIIGILLIATRKRHRNDPIPFGPFLALGALIALFWGNIIFDLYVLPPMSDEATIYY